jgi:hypothetical protein
VAEYGGRHDLIESGGARLARSARGIVAIFSENQKEGPWALPRLFRVLSIFGNVTVDLRDAQILNGESVIEAVAIFAEVKVIAPPHLNVECDGDAFMGEFAIKRSKRDAATFSPPDPGGPTVRVIGSAYMASVTVRVKPDKKKPSSRALLGGRA